MLKFVMMPPQDELQRQWADRLEQTLPQYRVAVPETGEDARFELTDADTAYGWVLPEARRFAADEPLHNVVNKSAWY